MSLIQFYFADMKGFLTLAVLAICFAVAYSQNDTEETAELPMNCTGKY